MAQLELRVAGTPLVSTDPDAVIEIPAAKDFFFKLKQFFL